MDAVVTLRPCAAPDCGEVFEVTNAGRKYCSESCRKSAWRWRKADRVARAVAAKVRRTLLEGGLL